MTSHPEAIAYLLLPSDLTIVNTGRPCSPVLHISAHLGGGTVGS